MVVGEFTLVQSENLELQVRYAPVPCDCYASIGAAAVISDGQHRIEFGIDRPGLMIVDGAQRWDLAERPHVTIGDLSISGGASHATVTDGHGSTIELRYGHKSVNVYITPGGDDTGWAGILGNANGNPDDDFRSPDGATFGSAPSQEVIEGAFADSWRITNETSLFTYGPGESTETFTNVTYPAPHPELTSEQLAADREARKPRAETICRLVVTDPGLREACISDFIVTGNLAILRGARTAELLLGLYPHVAASTGTTSGYGDTSGLPDGAAIVELEGRHAALGGGLALLQLLVEPEGKEDQHLLAAIDTASRTVRWVEPDIDRSCTPTVMDGVGVIALAAPDSQRLGDDKAALVVLSPIDGSEVGRFVPDDPHDISCYDLSSSGDVLVVRKRSVLRAYRVDDGFTFLWSRELPRAIGPAMVGDRLVALVEDSDTESVYATLDLESGDEVSRLPVQSDDVSRGITPLGEGLFAVQQADSMLSIVEVTGEGLRIRWTARYDRDEAEESPYPFGLPNKVARVGDMLMGWTGGRVTAFDLGNGDVAWTYEPSSFENNDGAIAGTADAVFIGPFGGAWVEAIGADGEVVKMLDNPPNKSWGEAKSFTAIDADTVLVTGTTATDGGARSYFAFVDR